MEEDDSDDGEGLEQVVANKKDTEISNEMQDNQSSPGNSSQSSNNRVTTPLPITPSRIPTLGKRMLYSTKKDAIEEKLLQIIEKLEKLDEDEMICISLATTLRKIQDPQKKEYAKMQL